MLGADNWGYYGANKTFNKDTYGFAGTAALTGDNVHQSNHCMFGFWSYIYLTERGKKIDVTISTHVDVNYAWLVALSFGKDAFGHVSVESESGVTASDAEQIVWTEFLEEENLSGVYETELLIDGVSPYGNWREGDIGVWQPSKCSDDACNSFSFSVTVPEDRDALVQIWEFIMLTAVRHHPWRTDRCTAVANVTCRFDPVKVWIQKKC